MADSPLKERFRQIDTFLYDHRQDLADNLVHLLRFNTVSGAEDAQEKKHTINELSRAYSFLGNLARKMDFSCRNYGNKVAVIEMESSGSEVLGLPLHLDVVPSGEGWHFPAFGGMVENDTIYGRGAQDDKGPIIQMLYAMSAIRALNLPLKRTIRMIVLSQEETGNWTDVHYYLEKEPAPQMNIIADSRFPIINAEKGMMDVEVRIKWHKPEARSGALAFRALGGGERSNIVPNRAEILWEITGSQAKGVLETLRICLQEYLSKNKSRGADAFPLRADTDPDSGEKRVHATFLGKSSHGSSPQEGHNAILDALDYFADLPEQPAHLSRVARFIQQTCADLHAGGLGIAATHKSVGPTTVNLGILDLREESARLVLNLRPTFGWGAQQVLKGVRDTFRAWAEKQGMEVEVDFLNRPREAVLVDPELHPELIGALKTAYQTVTGKKAELLAMSGTTYLKAFPNAVGFGPVLPDEEDFLAHRADECIKIDHVVRNARMYAAAMLLLAVDLEGKAL